MGRLRAQEEERPWVSQLLLSIDTHGEEAESAQSKLGASGLSARPAWLSQGAVAVEKRRVLPVLSAGEGNGMGVGGLLQPNEAAAAAREGALLKTSPGTFQLQGQRQGTWNPSVSQAQCLWQAWLARTFFIHCWKLFMAAMKQPLGEGLRKECVVGQSGLQVRPKEGLPQRAVGQVLVREHSLDL